MPVQTRPTPTAPAGEPDLVAAPRALPAANRGWVMPVVWILVVAYILVEAVWVSLATDPGAWRQSGDEPFTTAVLVLIVADLAFRIVIGVLVARDMKAIGAGRLKMAQLPATGLERTSPAGWGWTAGIFTLLVVIMLSIWRGRIRQLATQAVKVPQFADRKELKAAAKAPGVYPEPEFRAMRKRGSIQTIVFIGLFLGLNILMRL